MNQKLIDQLLHKAGARFGAEGTDYSDFTSSKFAELIVQECAELFVDQKYMILNPHEPFANERVRALKEHDKDTVKKIKHHFGVEL